MNGTNTVYPVEVLFYFQTNLKGDKAMYAAVTMMKLEPGHYDEMHEIATNSPERMKSMKGFISAVYYSDKEKNEFGTTTVWETKEDWDTYWNTVPSEFMDRINAISVEPYSMNTYYVNNAYSAE